MARPTDVHGSQNCELTTCAFWISIYKHGDSLLKEKERKEKEGKENHHAKEKCDLSFSFGILAFEFSYLQSGFRQTL